MLRGNPLAAIDPFRIALAPGPYLAVADYFLATAWGRIGRVDLAEPHYRRALQKASDHTGVPAALSRMESIFR